MAAKFTNSAQEALQQAQSEAIRRDHQELQPEHLLAAQLLAAVEPQKLPLCPATASGSDNSKRQRRPQQMNR